MRKSFHLLCAAACLLPVACATPGGGPAGFVMFDKNNHVSGAVALDGTADGRCFNNAAYVVALVGDGVAPKRLPQVCYDLLSNVNASKAKHANDEKAIRKGFAKTLMTTSESQCGSYRRFLTQFHGNVRSTFGISAQVAAIVATLATGGAGPWFAGASAALGGAGGTLHGSHFYDQALPTITDAFQKSREKKKEDIEKKLSGTDPYDEADVLDDVLEYHNKCSLDEGLHELAASLKDANEADPDALDKIIAQQKKNRQALRDLLKEEAAKDDAAVNDTAPADGADTNTSGADSGP